MITDKDIEKLKKVFATKDDLRVFATKDDIKGIRNELKNFATKDDLKELASKEDLKRYASKDDLQKTTDEMVKFIVAGFSNVEDKLDNILQEIKSSRIVLGNHEDRLQKVEHKIFS